MSDFENQEAEDAHLVRDNGLLVKLLFEFFLYVPWYDTISSVVVIQYFNMLSIDILTNGYLLEF